MTSPSPEQVRTALALQQIKQTYAMLDQWRARSRKVEVPQSGSELDGDAGIWPGLPPHQVARVSLISGVQHLNLARAAIEQREVFPIAHSTVLRSALLGAARGIWLLGPDARQERQQHALRTIHEFHRRLRQFVDEGGTDLDATDAAKLVADLDAKLAANKALWLQTPTLTAVQAPKETDIVGFAAGILSDVKQQEAVPALWMQLSGDAHGLGWPMLTRASTQTVSLGRLSGYPNPMAEVGSGADLFEIAEAYLAAFKLLQHGWSLFDRRCEAP